MSTIKERAKEYAKHYDLTYKEIQDAIEKAYYDGATDQKQIDNERLTIIDAYGNAVTAETFRNVCEIVRKTTRQKMIDKACEWLDDELYQIKRDDIRHPQDIASSSYYEKTELLRALRKAMEE